ncbi:MAG: hypothetical protein JW982_01790 [Spirochaetes bacterium]|nr:hypothetical protein [Spirochaetota bacterium]
MKSFIKIILILLFISSLLLTACRKYLRGTTEKSHDGRTYLMVTDDNGGACSQIKVDGNPWKARLNEKGEITPGVHIIECGGEIEFFIPEGTVFKFDYWGP